MNTAVKITAIAGRRRKRRIRKKKETWLDHKIIRGVRRMNLVGLKQALEPGLILLERLFWIGVFCTCLGAAVYLTVIAVTDYAENPIENSFREEEPIYKFPFPATTITGTMILTDNPLDDLAALGKDAENSDSSQFLDDTWDSRLFEILLHMLDHFCELVISFANKADILDLKEVERIELKKYAGLVDYMNVTLFDNKTDPRLKDSVIPVMKNKTLNCTKILAACYWEGEEGNCKEMFVPVQTDVGTGCTFNRVPEELLRNHQGLMSLLHDHEFTQEEIKKWTKFDIDSSISVEGMQDFYDLTYPRSQHQAGMLTGLSFLLVFDEDPKGTACPIMDSYGYIIAIHSPFEEPKIMQSGITVPPKTEVFISVKAEAVFADKRIRSLAVPKRRCYFQDEKPLKNFNFYTINNCHQECLGMAIKTNCSCSLITQTVKNNEQLCGPKESECVQLTTARLRKEGYDRRCQNPVCYSPCTEVKYHADATYLPYHKRKFFSFKDLKDDAVTSIVHVTHGSNMMSTRERKLRIVFSVLVGVIGGIWGMIMDITLFSLFNILAGFIAALIPKCINWKKVTSCCESKQEPDNQNNTVKGLKRAGNDSNEPVQRLPDVETPEPLSTSSIVTSLPSTSTQTVNERKKTKKRKNDIETTNLAATPDHIPKTTKNVKMWKKSVRVSCHQNNWKSFAPEALELSEVNSNSRNTQCAE